MKEEKDYKKKPYETLTRRMRIQVQSKHKSSNTHFITFNITNQQQEAAKLQISPSTNHHQALMRIHPQTHILQY
jgi:hypothetical protein